MRRNILFALLFISSIAYGQSTQQFPYERVLFPLAVAGPPIPGAQGSQWVVEAFGRNDASEPVDVTQQVFGTCGQCPPKPSASTFQSPVISNDPNTGGFVYIGAPGADGKVTFTLRTQDVSRQAQTWGTTIPVVRERDVRTAKITLLNFPVTAAFRNTLRVYDFDYPTNRVVRLRVYPLSSNDALVDTQITLLAPNVANGPELYPLWPGRALLTDLASTFPALSALTTPARIELDPVTPGLRFWAFLSTTNNETQHVTVTFPN